MDAAGSISMRMLAMTLHAAREQLGSAQAAQAGAPATPAAQADVILQLSAAAQQLVTRS